MADKPYDTNVDAEIQAQVSEEFQKEILDQAFQKAHRYRMTRIEEIAIEIENYRNEKYKEIDEKKSQIDRETQHQYTTKISELEVESKEVFDRLYREELIAWGLEPFYDPNIGDYYQVRVYNQETKPSKEDYMLERDPEKAQIFRNPLNFKELTILPPEEDPTLRIPTKDLPQTADLKEMIEENDNIPES